MIRVKAKSCVICCFWFRPAVLVDENMSQDPPCTSIIGVETHRLLGELYAESTVGLLGRTPMNPLTTSR
jgi:hypothetical protein